MARTKLSFATCNLYNLNLPGLSIYTTDGWSAAEYADKVDWTGAVLKGIAADVFGFQELWHIQGLEDVFEKAGLSADYELLVPAGHAGGRIVCGGAVRKNILEGDPEWIVNFPDQFVLRSGGDDPQTSDISVQIDRFSRPLLHFKIKPRTDGKVISVYVAHLKSKKGTEIYREGWYREDSDYYKNHRDSIGATLATIRRTAEACALRMILTEEIKGNDNPVVVLGDLNDSQHSNTVNILTGQPRYLDVLSRGGSDTDLYTVGTLQEYRSLRDVYYTHIHQNIRESLDHILVSQEFYDNSKKRIWAFKGMEVINDHLNRDDHKETGSSDHGIVCASFEYHPV